MNELTIYFNSIFAIYQIINYPVTLIIKNNGNKIRYILHEYLLIYLLFN